MTALEVVSDPTGREFVVEARPRGPWRGGGDGFSLAADVGGWLLSRVGKAGWVVEVRPWPVGRRLMREPAIGKDAALRRAEALAAEVTSGARQFQAVRLTQDRLVASQARFVTSVHPADESPAIQCR